ARAGEDKSTGLRGHPSGYFPNPSVRGRIAAGDSLMSIKLAPLQGSPFGVQGETQAALEADTTGLVLLRKAFDEHGLIVLRGRTLSMGEQLDICRIFGPVVEDSPWENFIISNTRSDGFLGAQQLLWHNDLAYLPVPYIGGSLHALEVADDATTTHFASGALAWDKLPQNLRERISGRTALHVKQKVFDRPNRLTDLDPGDVAAVHAVVRQHRATDRPYLFVSEDLTDSVIGLDRRDSDALLADLFACLYARGQTYEHRWHTGDLVIWDNEVVQHARGEISNEPRTLQRASIARLGYAQMYPSDLGIYGDQYDKTLADGTGAAAPVA
ncbi:MAG: TauD/TfdA family dioxygenase, partial [Novosphingobium sp.]|nr:TauD/TfdA family dioxygenase [Novosphingobium sp.]